MFVEKVRDVQGLGRWIYCKYCCKNVKPKLSGQNQVVCSICGYALTPDFFSFKALKHFLAHRDYDKAMRIDRMSEERRRWFEERGRHV
jgi:hypothetical protein